MGCTDIRVALKAGSESWINRLQEIFLLNNLSLPRSLQPKWISILKESINQMRPDPSSPISVSLILGLCPKGGRDFMVDSGPEEGVAGPTEELVRGLQGILNCVFRICGLSRIILCLVRFSFIASK